jgi:hypothetical protein
VPLHILDGQSLLAFCALCRELFALLHSNDRALETYSSYKETVRMKRLLSAVLLAVLACAMPLHAAEGKKKIVLVAGKDSHGRGEHEFRAGCMILQKALNENMPGSGRLWKA